MQECSKPSSQRRVLSLDWDYFVDATEEERLMVFPDGGNENLTARVSDFVWTGRYAGSRVNAKRDKRFRDIADIKVRPEYLKLRKYLRERTYTFSGVADSHLLMYNFIEQLDFKDVEIVNVDNHHDMFDFKTDELNCGNWLRLLIKHGLCKKAIWVKNPDSGSIEQSVVESKVVQVTEDFNEVLSREYDAVFLCRSRPWSPPHLDSRFISLLKLLDDRTEYMLDAQIEDIMKDRYKKMKYAIDNEEKQKIEYMELMFGREIENKAEEPIFTPEVLNRMKELVGEEEDT